VGDLESSATRGTANESPEAHQSSL
jgi:hypothetical protein